jgi:hypothetical protein
MIWNNWAFSTSLLFMHLEYIYLHYSVWTPNLTQDMNYFICIILVTDSICSLLEYDAGRDLVLLWSTACSIHLLTRLYCRALLSMTLPSL